MKCRIIWSLSIFFNASVIQSFIMLQY